MQPEGDSEIVYGVRHSFLSLCTELLIFSPYAGDGSYWGSPKTEDTLAGKIIAYYNLFYQIFDLL